MAKRAEPVGTVVIGAGQAGLANSYTLAQRGLDHVVLEHGRIGEAWRGRWDSLCMVLPNWYNGLPGFPYQGAAPDGFQTRDEWVADLARYAATFALPVREGVAVSAVAALPDGRFSLRTSAGALVAENVVVATGSYQAPRLPAMAAELSQDIHQIHSGGYRNPGVLPPGAVLVVGTGNSGSQIAEELHRAGRTVYLSVGYSGFPLRRYRGRDVFWWYFTAGLAPVLLRDGISPSRIGNFTGHDGGRALDLRRFARDGIRLLGRIRAIDGAAIALAPDLAASLADIDRRTDAFRRAVDAYIDATGLDAPTDEPSPDAMLGGADAPDSPATLDPRAAGIASVVWASGYGWDLAWLRVPVLDAEGAPRNAAGLSPCSGLFFAGMSAVDPLSTSIGRVGAEAERIVAAIAARAPAHA
jgi:putative flavoprotein involved in K+ transport